MQDDFINSFCEIRILAQKPSPDAPSGVQGLAPGVYYGAVPEPPNPYEPIPASPFAPPERSRGAGFDSSGGQPGVSGARGDEEGDASSIASGGHADRDLSDQVMSLPS